MWCHVGAIDDLRQEVDSLKSQLADVKSTSGTDLTEQFCELQEREQRKLNLRFDGVAESEAEDDNILVGRVEEILKDKLQLQLPKGAVVSVRRQGGRNTSTGKPRTVLVQVSSMAHRMDILKAKKRLGGRASQLAINEDLTKLQRDNIRAQLPKMKEARAAGRYAFFKGDVLVILPPRSPTRSPTASPRPQGRN